MSVEIGTHRNGERFARVYLSERGIVATIEGTGCDDDAATDNLRLKLRQLEEMCGDAADAMSLPEDAR
jgi:hypothetical protein